MPSYTWQCKACGETNPPHTEFCHSCATPAVPKVIVVDVKARQSAAWIILVGFAVMLGPIAIFFFVISYPSHFRENTILFWHYLSAFGLIGYGPLGLALIVIGIVLRRRARRVE